MPVRPVPVQSENHWFQLAETLKGNRRKRLHERLFFVEGVRSLNQLRARPEWEVTALLYCPERRLSGWARDVLRDLPAAQRLELTPALMDRLSDRQEGSEMIALVRIPRRRPSDLKTGKAACILLLDRPGNPGNLGSIVRSCDAFGATGILITGHAVDPYDPLVVRASAGAFFTQTIVRLEERSAVDAWLSGLGRACPGLRIVGTSAKAETLIGACDLTGPVVLCFGSETMGLSAWLKERCHVLAGMPMRGAATSLNLAAAVSAVLYETFRQREAA